MYYDCWIFNSKTHILRPEDSVVLSKISLYILCPCMIFSVFQIELSQSVISGLLMTLFLSILIHVMLIIAGTFVKRSFIWKVQRKRQLFIPMQGTL